MKKVFFLLVPLFLISCGTKYYVLNSHYNPRPTSQYKFTVDKNKSTTDINSVIDTSSIYLSFYFKRMTPGITGIYYHFMPNGVVYEVVLRGESIEAAVKDTAMGNYGKYRVDKNMIKMEFMDVISDPSVEKDSILKKKVVGRRFQNAEMKDGNLFLVPHYYRTTKGFYNEAGKLMGNPYTGTAVILLGAPVFLVDSAIPDKKICFYKVNLADVKNFKIYEVLFNGL